MQTRTRKQREVFEFISRYIDNHGHEPSYQLIARQMGLRSRSGIAKHIQALEDQGFLRRVRENGGFRLQVGRRETSESSDTAIDWIDAPATVGEPESWEMLPFSMPQFMLGNMMASEVFAYRVRDDSMIEKSICEGDVGIIESRAHARDGDCVVAYLKRKKELIMRTYYRAGSKIELHAANKNYAVIRLSGDQIEVKGVFLALLRPAR